MGDELNPAFSDALREMGRPLTVDQLRRRGVKRVRALGMAEVSLLIERAVNRTLLERTRGLDPAEAAELGERAQKELARQLAGLHELADSRMAVDLHRREVQEQLRQLRRELGLRRGFVEGEEPDQGDMEPDLSPALRLQLQACLLPFLEGSRRPPGPAIEQVLLNLAQLLRGELKSALRRQRQELEAEMEVLERRIEKLKQSVEDGEAALQRLAALEARDPGVASIYREVQGLSSAAPGREKKLALMASMYAANLELQRKL
jgi:hypothetical protein